MPASKSTGATRADIRDCQHLARLLYNDLARAFDKGNYSHRNHRWVLKARDAVVELRDILVVAEQFSRPTDD